MAKEVDVYTEIVIERPMERVAGYACDPDKAPEWYKNIKSIEWETSPPIAVGSRMAFVAHFLGRRMAYTYEVKTLTPTKMVRATAEGPFPMETTYTFEDAGDSKTKMGLRNRGRPSGFSAVVAPLMARAMKKANQKDLESIKRILETRS